MVSFCGGLPDSVYFEWRYRFATPKEMHRILPAMTRCFLLIHLDEAFFQMVKKRTLWYGFCDSGGIVTQEECNALVLGSAHPPQMVALDRVVSRFPE